MEVMAEDLRVDLEKAATVGAFVKVGEILIKEAAGGGEL